MSRLLIFLAPGLGYRSLDEIMRDTVTDEIACGLARPRRSGLTGNGSSTCSRVSDRRAAAAGPLAGQAR